MATKNYMINDKWLDLDKQNIVELQSVDGVLDSVKLNGEEYGGGGGSSDFSTAEVTVTGINYSFLGNNPNNSDIVGALLKSNNLCYSSYEFYFDERQTRVHDVILLGEKSGRFIISKSEGEVNISGDATISSDTYQYFVTFTGDCTITIS